MISNPTRGQVVQVWYSRERVERAPWAFHLHGQVGRVVIVARRNPRNHGIHLAGRLVVVPAGNLRKFPT